MMLNRKVALLVSLVIAACTSGAYAQDYVSREELLQMKQEMQELKALVGEMKTVIRQQQQTISELQEHKADAPHTSAAASAAEGRDAHEAGEGPDVHDLLSSIKPRISITGDFVANLSDDRHIRTEEDRFDLRGVDINLSGEIDDIGKAFVNIAYHEDDVVLEEAYLDVYDILPFKTDLRLGKFRTNFGLLNTVHPHALPQVDYPAIYRAYLGEEGYIDEGVGIAGEFPSLWGTPFQYTLQVLNGNRHDHGHDSEGLVLHDDHEDEYGRLRDYDDLVYVGRLQNTFRPADTAAVKWGLSGLSGKFEDDNDAPRFYYQAGDLTLTWNPFDDRHKRLRWQSEFITAQIEDSSSWERSYGLYSFLDYTFAPRWIAGVRYDYAELPLHSGDHVTEYSAYLTHDYTGSNRLRIQFKNTNRDYDKDTNELFLQWIFTLGKHEHSEQDGH